MSYAKVRKNITIFPFENYRFHSRSILGMLSKYTTYSVSSVFPPFCEIIVVCIGVAVCDIGHGNYSSVSE